LLAQQRGSHDVTTILPFDRSIDVVWSPDSNRIAITNHNASNQSNVVIAELPPGAVRNMEDEIHRTLKTDPQLFANGHRYFRVVRWQSNDALVIEVRAYDAQPGLEFLATFIYSLKKGVVTQVS
jgi:hypothetical protein